MLLIALAARSAQSPHSDSELRASQMRLSANDAIIGAIPLFKNCSRRVITEIVDLMVQRTYLPGDLLIEKGDASQEMFMIRSGVVELIGAGDQGESIFISTGSRKPVTRPSGDRSRPTRRPTHKLTRAACPPLPRRRRLW